MILTVDVHIGYPARTLGRDLPAAEAAEEALGLALGRWAQFL